MTATVLLAYDPNNVKPGWIALVLVVALCVVTFLLWRSMNSQLRKIQMPAKPGRPPIPQNTGGSGRATPPEAGTAPDRADTADPRLPPDRGGPQESASRPEHPEGPPERG
jgi:hypothetical protein